MTFLDQIEASIPALRRYARALLRDREAADDLVQDCLERAIARRASWRGEAPVQAWLFAILNNRHRDLARRARPHLVAVSDLPNDPPCPGNQESALALSEVHAAMGQLPEDQRAALLLVAVEGMSIAEAAEALSIPTGTMLSRLGRARARLRDLTGRTAPGPATKTTKGKRQP